METLLGRVVSIVYTCIIHAERQSGYTENGVGDGEKTKKKNKNTGQKLFPRHHGATWCNFFENWIIVAFKIFLTFYNIKSESICTGFRGVRRITGVHRDWIYPLFYSCDVIL